MRASRGGSSRCSGAADPTALGGSRQGAGQPACPDSADKRGAGCGGQPEERATSESHARRAGEVAAQPFETTRMSQTVSEGECRRPKWAPAGPATQGRGDSRAGGAVRQDRSSASPGSRRHPLSTDGATEAAQSGTGRLGVGGTGGTPRQSFPRIYKRILQQKNMDLKTARAQPESGRRPEPKTVEFSFRSIPLG